MQQKTTAIKLKNNIFAAIYATNMQQFSSDLLQEGYFTLPHTRTPIGGWGWVG
jgi:hypothetical protein